jgi:hypothetical protein
MTTLAALKAEIADDLDRTDITTQIASAITNAINHYKKTRFFFNEARTVTFTTVADQDTYTSSDQVSIPLMFDFDVVTITVDDDARELVRMSHAETELLNDASASTGEPVAYAYFNQAFRLYPIPDDAYVVRIVGGIKTAAPASDAEANNVWMTEAYELIRCRAKAYLGVHVVKDADMAGTMAMAEKDALDALYAETSRKKASGQIRATTF